MSIQPVKSKAPNPTKLHELYIRTGIEPVRSAWAAWFNILSTELSLSCLPTRSINLNCNLAVIHHSFTFDNHSTTTD